MSHDANDGTQPAPLDQQRATGHTRPRDTPTPETVYAMTELQLQLATLTIDRISAIPQDATGIAAFDPSDYERHELTALGWCGCLPCWAAFFAAATIATLIRAHAESIGAPPDRLWAHFLAARAEMLRDYEGDQPT